MGHFKLSAIGATLLVFCSSSAFAQEILIKDNITGLAEAATNALNNQTAGAGGRQVLLTQHTFTGRTEITRFLQLSSSTAMPFANGFSYSVRSLNTPHAELASGTATRVSRTVYTDVTRDGDNTNLDEFTISGLILDPGTYYFTVHASDGNAYQSIAHTASAGGVEPLLAENGGVPFLAGANFHLYTQLFGIVTGGLAFETDLVQDFIPAAVDVTFSASGASLGSVGQRLAGFRSASASGEVVTRGIPFAAAGGSSDGLQLWADAGAVGLIHEATPNMVGYDGTSIIGTFGADYHLGPSLVIGAAYSRLETTSSLGNSVGEVDESGNQFTVYAQHANDSGFYANALYSYGSYQLDLERTTAAPGIANGATDAELQNFQVGIGYQPQSTGPFSVDYSATLRYSTITVDGYTETSAAAGVLAIGHVTADGVTVSAGMNVRYDGGRFQPYAGLLLERSTLDLDNVSLALVSNPATVNSGTFATDLSGVATVRLGLDYAVSDDIMLNTGYTIRTNTRGTESQQLHVGIQLQL